MEGLFKSKNLYYLSLKLIERLFKIYIPATWLELDWLANHFWSKYPTFEEHHHLNSFRRQNLQFIMREIDRKKISGDILECGVYKGFSAWILLSESKIKRNYFGIDTFTGLSAPTIFDGNHWKEGDLDSPIRITEQNLTQFNDRVHIYQGSIPDIFDSLSDNSFCFALVHIDVDLYIPTKSSLEFAWPNLAVGGVVLCDDYGFTTCPGATKAINEFIDSGRSLDAVIYPTGGIALKKTDS
jgi:O-methyltransferase